MGNIACQAFLNLFVRGVGFAVSAARGGSRRGQRRTQENAETQKKKYEAKIYRLKNTNSNAGSRCESDSDPEEPY